MKKFIFTAIFSLFFLGVFGQAVTDSLIVKIDSLSNALDIESSTFFFIDKSGALPMEKVLNEPFKILSGYKRKNLIPLELLSKPAYLKFTLQNTGTGLQTYYFYPGLHFDHKELYAVRDSGKTERLPITVMPTGFVDINIPPGKPVTFLLKLKFTQSEYERLSAALFPPGYAENFIQQLSSSNSDKRIASYILCGILFMMILLMLVNYFVSFKSEFLYNAAFSGCMLFLIFFSTYLNKRPDWFSRLFMNYIDLMLLIMGTVFYVLFIRKFLDTKKRHTNLDKLFRIENRVLIALMFIFTYMHFQTEDVVVGLIIENSMKVLALVVGVIFIIKGLRQKDRLMQYIAMGSAAQILLSLVSFVLLVFKISGGSIFRSPLFYFEMGIIMAVFFFLLGLTYKNRRDLVEKTQEQEAMKLEAEKKLFENQLAIIHAQQEERNRISADMHDDLGAGMTSIRLFSELAMTKMGDNKMPEIEKISSSADELLNKMNAIIWSMTSSNDSLGNMVAYIRSYALEYFENTGIGCSINIPEDLPEMEVPGVIRRNVFLVVKESLNNIVKHAGANKVEITMQKETNGFSLIIHDDGKGIDFEKIREFGNGLKNMKKRMDDVSMEFSIENNNGTLVKIYREFKNPNNRTKAMN